MIKCNADGVREDQKFDLHRYINDRATEDLKSEEVNDLHLRFDHFIVYNYQTFSRPHSQN